jgi:hypothetical protein
MSSGPAAGSRDADGGRSATSQLLPLVAGAALAPGVEFVSMRATGRFLVMALICASRRAPANCSAVLRVRMSAFIRPNEGTVIAMAMAANDRVNIISINVNPAPRPRVPAVERSLKALDMVLMHLLLCCRIVVDPVVWRMVVRGLGPSLDRAMTGRLQRRMRAART